MSHSAYIALGSNHGNREVNLRRAADLLGQLGAVQIVAPAKEYPAVDSPPDSPPFLNSAAALQTNLSPAQLLDALLNIEQQMGRARTIKNAPRIIDLDLLLFDQMILHEPHLKVPHPRMHQRRFVLEPLAAIAPQVTHPSTGKTIAELLTELQGSQQL